MAKSLNKKQSDYLKKVYFDSKSPVSFSGLQRVWNHIKEEGIVSRSELKQWLQAQDTYTSYHPFKRKFKRPRVVVAKVDDVWGLMLLTWSHTKSRMKVMPSLLCLLT